MINQRYAQKGNANVKVSSTAMDFVMDDDGVKHFYPEAPVTKRKKKLGANLALRPATPMAVYEPAPRYYSPQGQAYRQEPVSPAYDLKGAAEATARGGMIEAGIGAAGNVASSIVSGLNTEVLHGEIDEDLNIVIDEFRVTVGEIIAVGGVAAAMYLLYMYKKGAFKWDPFGLGAFGSSGGGLLGNL
jgi:hypothetical protein